MKFFWIIVIAISAYLGGYNLQDKKYILFLMNIVTFICATSLYIRG